MKPLARTLVTYVVNLRPKTTIFSEKAVGLTTFVTTDRKSTQKHLRLTTFVTTSNRSARNRSSLGPCDAHGRHHSGQAPLVWRAQDGPEGLAAVPVGGSEAWTGFEAGPGCGARGRRRGLAGLRAGVQAHVSTPGPTGVEGAGGSGGHGRASRSTTPSEARVWRSRGRPGPTAPGTPAVPQATPSMRQAAAHGAARPSRKQ